MASRKKNDDRSGGTPSGRQLSLFSFCQKMPIISSDQQTKTEDDTNTGNLPKTPKTPMQSMNMKTSAAHSNHSSKFDDDSDIDENIIFEQSSTKRRRIVISSDEDDDITDVPIINVSDQHKTSTPIGKSKPIVAVIESTPTTARRLKSLNTLVGGRSKTAKTPIDADASFQDTSIATDDASISMANLSTNSVGLSTSLLLAGDNAPRTFDHLDHDFLKSDMIRDAAKRRPDDEDYDPHTLYVPDAFLKRQTPGHRQWWQFKSQYFDTILLFKVGKFYELYHMDAVVAVTELGLGSYAHCGFPETAYGRYSHRLLDRGYRVARIEQTETPDQLQGRNQSGTKMQPKEKVVRRELCQITTPATRTYGVLDGMDPGDRAAAAANGDREKVHHHSSAARYLLAIAEKYDENGLSTYGVCFVDTSVGQFYIGQFVDDLNRSFLRTAIAHYQPAQVLIERGKSSSKTESILKGMLSGVLRENLASKREFLNADDTVKCLCSVEYFGQTFEQWPSELRTMLDSNASIATASATYRLCWSAIGAVIWCLKRCLIDVDMLTMRQFERYVPLSLANRNVSVDDGHNRWLKKRLVLDGITLRNLNIVPTVRIRHVESNEPEAAKYSLFSVVDRCSTAFGKRLLRQYVCAPLCDPIAIRHRQDSIEMLIDAESTSFVDNATALLKPIPDLDRLLQRIHTLGLKYRSEMHPDSRAVMFEPTKYNKRKIFNLLLALGGFQKCVDLMRLFRNAQFSTEKCQLLYEYFGDDFPQIDDDLKHFKVSFDHEHAQTAGVIVPRPGLDDEYDQSLANVIDCERQLNRYLADQRKALKCSKIVYVGSGRNRFQLEVPSELKDSLGTEYTVTSSRKGFVRYKTMEIEELFKQLQDAESKRATVLHDIMRRVFADFDKRFDKWHSVVQRVAHFDVLLSLAKYVRSSSLAFCRPEFIITSDNEKPIIDIVAGVHPCLAANFQSRGVFIPNDTVLGGDNHMPILLLTGANMGGKSTLMRQIALLVVLAQMGSMVPAKQMRLSPVDRIFTRIGASDRIAAGQSTFFVELYETNVILRDGTRDSLAIIDELGRGTATLDGTAIAYAVLRYLAEKIQCRTIFSTHYHNLVVKLAGCPNIASGHMGYMVENENDDDPTKENVTFLYKLTDGQCPKSYGFNVAKMAGIPDRIIKEAHERSKLMSAGVGDSLKKEYWNEKLIQLKKSAVDVNVTDDELAAMIATL